MPSKSVLCLTVLGGGVLSCELVRRRALVTRISAGVSSHREVGEFSPESTTYHGIETELFTTRHMGYYTGLNGSLGSFLCVS